MSHDALRQRIKDCLGKMKEPKCCESCFQYHLAKKDTLEELLEWIDEDEQTDINDARFNASRGHPDG